MTAHAVKHGYSIREIEAAFYNHCAGAGVIFTDNPLIADSVLHRAHVDGDKRGTKNGAYILHADGNPSGWFQHFKTGIAGKWTMSGKRQPMTRATQDQIRAELKRRQAEQQQRHKDAADKARFIWSNSKLITDPSKHNYLVIKHVLPYGVRLYRGDTLVIPIYSQNRQLVNVQLIQEDGSKRFLSGGKKKGCFSVIGKHENEQPVLICEGWATGASLHESTGHSVFVALDAGNLESVALAVKCLFPSAQIIVAGDNDESGTGQKYARAAALAVGGKYIIPETVGHDWNDVINAEVSDA